VSRVLADGLRTADIAPDGQAAVGTTAMANAVIEALG